MTSKHLVAVNPSPELSRCPIMPTYGPPTVQFLRGEGVRLWDATGKEYLDFLSGLAVTSLGHSHPAVAEAISTQALRLQHVSNLFATEHNAAVATTLDRLIGDGVAAGGQTFFCNSGAEANEAAIKLSRRFGGHGRHTVVSAYSSFHGRTLATLAATGQPAKWEGFAPLPEGFKHVPWGDLEEISNVIDPSTAAIFIEAVQGEGGVNPATREYFAGIRQLCDEHGILFIVDEVQTGLARTGRWFGFQHFDVAPDVVTMAKALGNGMPIGCCWAKADVASSFKPGDHATTFGGQPLATAAAVAVLETMEEIDAPTLASVAGDLLMKALKELDSVVEVRGLGLLLAAELEAPIARRVAERCLDDGLVINAVSDSALRFAPPLIVSETDIVKAVETVDEAITYLSVGSS